MHATDTILFSSLPGIMMKVCVKFRPDPINGFWEKVERTDVRTNEENYNIDINDCALTQKWLYFSEFLGGAAQIFFREGANF